MKTELQVDDLPGQLLSAERTYLTGQVIKYHPSLILEVGCGCGAGSTYAMARAVRANGEGVIYACEVDEIRLSQARKLFEPWPFVNIRGTTGAATIQWLMDCNRVPDFIFFDGPEDETVALADLQQLEIRLRTGANFLMHDWDMPENSVKAKLIRPYIEGSSNWKKINCLTSPESVGLCHYKFVGVPT